jgi:PAS domain S-box-containing protein
MGTAQDGKKTAAWFMSASQCPVSGLPVQRAAAMTGRYPEIPYQVEMARLGDRILLLKATGFVTGPQMSEAVEFADDFISQSFDKKAGMVVIEDYSGVKGTDMAARKQYFEFFRSRRFFIGAVLYNMKVLIKISFNLARRFHFSLDRIHMVDTYGEAVSIASGILEECPAPTAGKAGAPALTGIHEENRLPSMTEFSGDPKETPETSQDDGADEKVKEIILRKYADGLLRYIASIDWEKNGSPAIDPRIAAAPCIGDVIRAISIIKTEIDMLIQERMAAEKILTDSENRFRQLVEHAQAGIFTLEYPSGKIIRANDAFLEILGRKRDEVLGHTPGEFITPESQALFSDRVKRVLSGVESLSKVEYQVMGPQGRIRHVLINAQVVRREGRPVAADVIVTDISYLKQIETELLKYQERLKRLSVKLSMTEEAQRRELASQLHDRVSQELFVAHLQLAAFSKSLNDPEQKKVLAGIKEQIISVIKETKTLTFDLSPPVLFDLGFTEAVESLAATTEAKHRVKVNTAFRGEMDQIDEGIKVIYYRNIKELIHNAIKHARAQIIEIQIINTEAGLTAEVMDDGNGFDIRNTTAHCDGQESFGLFDIREKISHLGGTLDIWSSPGTGTHVRMTVPLS